MTIRADIEELKRLFPNMQPLNRLIAQIERMEGALKAIRAEYEDGYGLKCIAQLDEALKGMEE